MSENSNPTAPQQNMKKLPLSKILFMHPQWLTFTFKYLREFFIKIWNGPHGILKGPGNWFMRKTWSQNLESHFL
jgi:hypothetical protein